MDERRVDRGARVDHGTLQGCPRRGWGPGWRARHGAWVNPGAEYFWLGIQISPTYTSHHGGADWDGIFFGLWNGAQYQPQPTYPPRAVDTHGFDRPPIADTLQDVLGTMRYAGSGAPYSFTAEWRRPLKSGDTEDLSYEADGATAYNFFVTTDSDG